MITVTGVRTRRTITDKGVRARRMITDKGVRAGINPAPTTTSNDV